MQAFLRERFELTRVFRRSPTILTFAARDTWNLNRPKVARVVRSSALSDLHKIEEQLSWFHGCRHPHLIHLQEVLHTPRGDVVIVRDFVEGEPGLNLSCNAATIQSLLSICLFLREQRAVHGGIHNGNVILTPHGGLRLVDGAIRGLTERRPLTSEIHWLAPELLRGGSPTLESDLYALGALLHEACFGATLFTDPDVDTLRLKYLHAKPIARRAEERAFVVDPQIILGLMCRDPSKRSQHLEALAGLCGVRSRPAEQAAFVGRRVLLTRAIDPLEQNASSVRTTLVEGTSGTGKSRFLDEVGFRARLRGHHVAFGTAYERDNRRFEPILQVISEWASQSSSDFIDWLASEGMAFHATLRALLPEECQIGETEEQRLSIEQMAADLTAVVIAMARRYGSLLLLLDDLHWADSGTWMTIRHLSLRRNDAKLGVLLSSLQPVGSAHASSQIRALRSIVESVTLAPLDLAAAESLAGALLGDHTQRELRSVALASQGNPLMVEEIARSGLGRKAKFSSPSSSALTAQFERADPSVQRVAEALSMFGTPIDQSVVHSLCAREGLADADVFATLVASGLFFDHSGDFKFRHDGVRRAIYNQIPKARRARLHSWAYDALRALNATDDTLAFHAGAAGDAATAAGLYRMSALEKLRVFDFVGASAAFKEALRFGKRAGEPPTPKVLLAYAECLSSMGRMRCVINLLPEKAISAWPPEFRTRADEALGAATRSRPRESVKYFERTVFRADPSTPFFYLSLMRLALSYSLAGMPSRAEGLLPRLRAILESHPDEYEHRRSLYAVVLTSLFRHSEAVAMFAQPFPGGPFELQILTSRGLCGLYLGDVAGAFRCHSTALRMARKRGSLAAELVALLNLVTLHLVTGRFDRAEALLREAHAIRHASSNDGSDTLTFPLLIADEIDLRTAVGEYDHAGRLLRRRFRSTLRSPPTYLSVFLMLRAAQYFAATSDDTRRQAAVRYVSESEWVGISFFRNELLIQSSNWLDERTLPESSIIHDCTLGSICPHHESDLLLLEAVLLARSGAHSDSRLTLRRLSRNPRLREFHGARCRAAVVLGLSSDRFAHAIRYLRAAVRMARVMRLPEVESRALAEIAGREASRGNRVGAYRSATRGIRLLRRLASAVPRHSRNSYLGVKWRKEMMSMIRQLGFDVNNAAPGAHPLASAISRYFTTIYELSARLTNARNPEQVITGFGEAVAVTGRAIAIALGEAPCTTFSSGNRDVTARLTTAIPQLAGSHGENRFFGSIDLRIEAEVVSHPVAWIPLSYRSTFLGGMCLDLSKKDMTEAELDFCTLTGRMASTALAALLWAPPSSVEDAPDAERDDGIVGSSAALDEVRSLIGIAAASDASTLIEGESGTGKELVAQAIHSKSSRRGGPLVTVDCGAIPEGLIESELFGAKRGAFTGAHADRAGMIESAHGGTLFLDEIGNTGASLQVKLLRVLQERKVRRVGENRGRAVDIRLIAATNADLGGLVERGLFRKDLFYRINVLHISIPPLRDRREDISELAMNFLGKLNRSHGTHKRFGTNALGDLMAGEYAGNVRELQNIVERAFFMAGKKTVIQDLRHKNSAERAKEDDIATWFDDLRSGRQNFWEGVHERYRRRDISRQKVTALMHVGLRETRGSYKNLARLLRVRDSEYRRFMDFLRRNKCQPDFRPYRRLPPS